MVFVNFLLAQLLFGSGHGVLDWTDGLTQGIFCDVYIVARRGRAGVRRWREPTDCHCLILRRCRRARPAGFASRSLRPALARHSNDR